MLMPPLVYELTWDVMGALSCHADSCQGPRSSLSPLPCSLSHHLTILPRRSRVCVCVCECVSVCVCVCVSVCLCVCVCVLKPSFNMSQTCGVLLILIVKSSFQSREPQVISLSIYSLVAINNNVIRISSVCKSQMWQHTRLNGNLDFYFCKGILWLLQLRKVIDHLFLLKFSCKSQYYNKTQIIAFTKKGQSLKAVPFFFFTEILTNYCD